MKKLGLAIAIALLLSAFSHAETHSEPVLRWAADAEGGAPYIFQDPNDPTKTIGYEADVMEALAKELGMKSHFVQAAWDSLILGLLRKDYDVVINGLEITEDRKKTISFTVPYYITYEQLTVRKEVEGIQSLSDLNGKKAGTLKATLAERILQAEKGIETLTYDGQVTPYGDLAEGRLDAVLMDAPIALYYASPDSRLKLVGAPVSQVVYGIGVHRENAALLNRLNQAILKLRQNGVLREIYERWGLWNPYTAAAFADTSVSQTEPTEYRRYLKAVGVDHGWKAKVAQYFSFLPMMAEGAWVTLWISVFAMAIAVAWGLALAIGRLYGPAPISALSIAYIEIIRGTPLLIQIYFMFFGLPHLGIKLSPVVAGILSLGLNYAAYEAENYRAGILAIPKHQFESALALGMTRFEALRHVILPQAIRVALPPVTNDFISLIKDSSLVSLITIVELTKVYGSLAATYYDYFGVGIMTAAIYFLIGLPFVRLSRWLENRLTHEHVHGNAPRRAL